MNNTARFLVALSGTQRHNVTEKIECSPFSSRRGPAVDRKVGW